MNTINTRFKKWFWGECEGEELVLHKRAVDCQGFISSLGFKLYDMNSRMDDVVHNVQSKDTKDK